jgi:Secretion system C-terminal sorting domain
MRLDLNTSNMKSKYLQLILFLFVSTIVTESTFAQFVLNYDQFLHPGDSVSTVQLDTSNFSPGNSGANITWDYSAINITQTVPFATYYTPNTTPQCLPYPANIAYGWSSSWPAPPEFHYDFFQSDSTQFSFIGKCELIPMFGSHYIRYTDPYAHIVGPLSYQDSTTDTFSGMELTGINIQDTTIIEGYTDFHYDAYGELRLPWGTFYNAIRIKKYSFRKDSIVSSSNGSGQVKIYAGTSYEWYDYNHRGWILGYGEGVTTVIPANGQTTTNYYKVVIAHPNLPTGLHANYESNEAFNIFPNPSNGQFTIQIIGGIRNKAYCKFILSDLEGRIIHSQDITDNQGKLEIDLPSVHKGMYFATLLNESGVISNKIIIE